MNQRDLLLGGALMLGTCAWMAKGEIESTPSAEPKVEIAKSRDSKKSVRDEQLRTRMEKILSEKELIDSKDPCLSLTEDYMELLREQPTLRTALKELKEEIEPCPPALLAQVHAPLEAIT